MKPATIGRFDLFYLAWIGLTVVDFFLQRDAYNAQVSDAATGTGFIPGSGFVIGVFVVWTLFLVLLWWLVSRKRSVVAKWIVVALAVVNFVSVPSLLRSALSPPAIVSWLILVVSVVAALSLFGAGAKAWFAGNVPAEPATGD